MRLARLLLPALISLAAPAQAPIKTAPLPEPKLERERRSPLVAVPHAGEARKDPIDPAPPTPLTEQILHDEVDGTLWAVGGTYKASFSAQGATFVPYFAEAPRNFPLTFSVRIATCDGSALPVQNAQPARTGDTIAFRHGGLRAVYELRRRAVEQTFWFDTLPSRGEIVVEVAYDTELHAESEAGGITFRCGHGAVTYGAAVVVDATGTRLPIPTELEPGLLRFRVPAAFVAEAVLPLCIDPLVGNEQVVYTSTSARPAGRSDIAYEPIFGEYAVVFQRTWSATDVDVFLTRYDRDMNPRLTHTIDATSAAWEEPKVAANTVTGLFLVVAQVSSNRSSPFWIAGRTIGSYSGFPGAPTDIERGGVPGDKMHPDVGGDMEYTAPTHFAVVWERVFSAADHDIHMKLVTHHGQPIASSLTFLDNTTGNERNPTISKTDGVGSLPTRCWGVAWQRTHVPGDEDIRGALVRWDGAVVKPSFSIDGSSYNSTVPTVTSPTDERNGQRLWLFAYQDDNKAGSIQIYGTLIDQTATWRGGYTLTAALHPTWPHFAPSADCDGTRFVIGYQEWYLASSTDVDTRLATFAHSPSAGLILQDNSSAGSTTGNEYGMQVTSTHVLGGNQVRFGCTWTHSQNVAPGDTTIRTRRYDGMVASGGFSKRATACGTGASFQVFGQPVLGGRVTLQQDYATAARGYVIGVPATLPIGPCPGCVLGVSGETVLVNSLLYLDIPADPAVIGAVVACQAFQLAGGPCLGAVAFSDTLDIKIQ